MDCMDHGSWTSWIMDHGLVDLVDALCSLTHGSMDNGTMDRVQYSTGTVQLNRKMSNESAFVRSSVIGQYTEADHRKQGEPSFDRKNV
jgi:hypothetical protein